MTISKHVGNLARYFGRLRSSQNAPGHPHLGLQRGFSSLPAIGRSHNVLAKYAPRPVHVDDGVRQPFLTASTQPVASSFQTVPPPESLASVKGVQVRNPLPAMIPPSANSTKPSPSSKGEMLVQGVHIPAKPKPPGEEDCCMSGCVHCVYTIYADDLELYTEALKSARQALTSAKVPMVDWPASIRENAGQERGIKAAEERKVEQNVDPAMAAFLALEGRLKKKQVT